MYSGATRCVKIYAVPAVAPIWGADFEVVNMRAYAIADVSQSLGHELLGFTYDLRPERVERTRLRVTNNCVLRRSASHLTVDFRYVLHNA